MNPIQRALFFSLGCICLLFAHTGLISAAVFVLLVAVWTRRYPCSVSDMTCASLKNVRSVG